jgi:hypothetical protein
MGKMITVTVTVDQDIACEAMGELCTVIGDLNDCVRDYPPHDDIELIKERIATMSAFLDAWEAGVRPATDTKKKCTCDSKTLLIKGCQCGGE